MDKKYDEKILQNATKNTFEKRNTSYQTNHIFFSTSFKPTRINWNSFLKQNNLEEKATFEEVVTYLQNTLEPFYESLKK